MIRVAAGIVVRDGKVMLCQRKATDALALKWEFPGGKLEAGETFGQALERELYEELGIRTHSGRAYAARRVESNGRTLLIAFLFSELTGGEPETLDCNAVVWAEPAQLTGYDLAPADAEVAAMLAADAPGACTPGM